MEPGGVHFSLYAERATAVELLFFHTVDDAAPSQIIRLDARRHRTQSYWHASVPGATVGQVYGFRVYGPSAPERGLRFDPTKVLLDPYGLAVAVPAAYDRQAAVNPGDNCGVAMKSVVADPECYDWEGDRTLNRPFVKTIVYEMHVGGFTRHPNSGVSEERRGTFAGLIEKIPYLQDLGITAVELLPIFQFDPWDAPAGRINYWGYAPVSFFAPHAGYSSRPDLLGPLDEFRDMVKALHRAGIEVILDVVYNHTAEGGHDGPTFCFRGIANDIYYIPDPDDRGRFANYIGCGNTLNANHSVVRRMIIDSLRYWVEVMHVDGFRFDLASIFSRDETGRPVKNPPVVFDIETDPVLAGAKFIAEAWDAGGLYEVGNFHGERWQEWNGLFRDDVRSFLKGDAGMARTVAARLLASPDIYGHHARGPEQSINFVTAHDGFTLNDLVSYNFKQNDANGEGNRDGTDDNRSWNCGVEGPTGDPAIEALRNRQVKNFLALTLLSLGTPMLLMGDEVRRSQQGNNNAYCQDNELSWFDWSLVDKHADILRFVMQLNGLRHRNFDVAFDMESTVAELLHHAQIRWHGTQLAQPDWGHDSRTISLTTRSMVFGRSMHVFLNAFWEPLAFELPPALPGTDGWHRVIDTSQPSPDDIRNEFDAPVIEGSSYLVGPRSVVLLIATKPQAYARLLARRRVV